MSTRKIKNARDLESNELIYFKSHAQATFMSDGSTVEDVINEIKETEGGDLSNYVTTEQLNTSLSGKQDTITDLTDIRSGALKGATAVQPASVATAVTINGVNKTISSNKINVGTVVTGITMNGSAKTVSSGNVNLGTVITAHQDISGKQDKLVSGTNIKTVMGKSLLGSGNVSISGSEITSIPATNIVAPTGVKYKSNDVWTIYSSQVPYHRANRLAFLEDDEFLFETSTDSGSTWTALSKNDDQRKVFIGENKGYVSFPSNPSNRVRVTLTPKTTRYFMADWFYIWVSVPYASPAPTTVDIEYSTGSAPDTWLTYATNIPIEGQTGPNMIWYGKLMGSGTSNKNVRFTFKNNNNSSVNIQIKGIEAHGIKSWIDINTMARTDHIYSVGVDKSATFPGIINCVKVNISGDTIATQNTMKTINGQSIIGRGDIEISGSGSLDANVQAVDTGDVLDDVNVDYATTAYVDGLVGDINTVLESIINSGGNASIFPITLTIGDNGQSAIDLYNYVVQNHENGMYSFKENEIVKYNSETIPNFYYSNGSIIHTYINGRELFVNQSGMVELSGGSGN